MDEDRLTLDKSIFGDEVKNEKMYHIIDMIDINERINKFLKWEEVIFKFQKTTLKNMLIK